MKDEFLISAIVFFAIYQIVKLLADYLLRRKLIKAGQYDKAGILEPPKQSEETNKYPSLKWGLVALTTGIGFIFINYNSLWRVGENGYRYLSEENFALNFGILMISVSIGFLIYFVMVKRMKDKSE